MVLQNCYILTLIAPGLN